MEHLCIRRIFSDENEQDARVAAERDIRRLKINWIFVISACLVRSINYSCVIPTNHQFIINPTAKSLNITDEKIEPGLEKNEAFYSLTYVALFMGHTTSAIAMGLLFCVIPTWYLFLSSTLAHIVGYILYAMATSGWMMLLARALAGYALGSVMSLTFSYYGSSFDKYQEYLKVLGKYDEKKASRTKGYVFSSYRIGFVLGNGIGVGFPVILAQFPGVPQFRPAGWFCVAAGMFLLFLQFILFQGECKWKCGPVQFHKKCPKFKKNKSTQTFCQIFIPLYVIVVGGLKGMRYILPEVLLNPIVSDSFGFSAKETTYIFLVLLVIPPFGLALLYVLQYFKFKGFGLSIVGMLSTITALLFLTDWQAIGTDPCMNYSLFHHPQLADQYRLELSAANVSTSGMVSVQSLKVVEGAVYQLAVNRCESAGEDCHWIPNSLVTHRHCSDCQPICRSTRHTLTFPQFVVGLVIFFLTLSFSYTGMFLLISETVSQSHQGIAVGAMVALIGAARSVFPLLLDSMYEHAQKRTYLTMLIQVGVYVPLLVGLVLLYPWLAGSRKVKLTDDQ